jgi:hypothetical protein
MSQTDLDVLEGRINDYKRTDNIFDQANALDILNSLDTIKSKVLLEDETLFNSVVNKMKIIAFPPVPIIPIPPPLKPEDIRPLLEDIQNL